MSSNVMVRMTILSLFYMWISCSMIETLTKNYFNRDNWFGHGNIFHIENEIFRTNFQQHRNVNRHIHWLTDEIASINRQIQSIRDQTVFAIHSSEQQKKLFEEYTAPTPTSSKNIPPSTKKLSLNHRNIIIIRSLSNQTLFHRSWRELIEIYQYFPLTTVIECIAVIKEENLIGKHLLIKLSDGNIDKYAINGSKSLKSTLWKITQPVLIWNNDGRQPEYYRRFIPIPKSNEIISMDQLVNIKNRPKTTDVNFFDMMGQILRVKYHTDPSSLSCILEMFFGDIYTCDGRLIYPHELKLLSDDYSFFVFYAVMMDTRTERQIFPLDNNNHIRQGDQIFFLFQSHPQYQSLSSFACTDCPRNERTYILNNDNSQPIEQAKENPPSEPTPSTDNLLPISLTDIPQNYIVYAILTSILIYILVGICLSRKEQPLVCSSRKPSISSRRGR